MEAELEQVEAALAENAAKQTTARSATYYYEELIRTLESQMRNTTDRMVISQSQQSIYHCRNKIAEADNALVTLERERERLLERKLVLTMKLQTV